MDIHSILGSGPFLRMMAITLGFYLFFAWYLQKIANKQGLRNTWMSWIPLLNFIILGRTAGYGAGLILLFFIPLINFFVLIHAWHKVALRMGKSGWYVLLLFIPLVNLYAIHQIASGEFILSANKAFQSKPGEGLALDKCSNCGAKIESEDRYCGDCGTAIGIGSSSIGTNQTSPIGKSVAGLLLLAILFYGGYFVYNKIFNKPDDSLSSNFEYPTENYSENDLPDLAGSTSDDLENAGYQKEVLEQTENENQESFSGIENTFDDLAEENSNQKVISLGGSSEPKTVEDIKNEIVNYKNVDDVPDKLLDQLEEATKKEESDQNNNLDPKISNLGRSGPVERTTISLGKLSGEVFSSVEDMPRFPGCEKRRTIEEKKSCANDKMQLYFRQKMRYPTIARTNRTEGKVYVSFIVDEKGFIREPKVVKDIGDGCGEEALRLIEQMNTMDQRWVPGKQRGSVVNVRLTIPVYFKL